MSNFKRGLTYDDVCLLPAYSNVESRLDPDTTTWLTNKIQIKFPIINAPMDTVIGFELADLLLERGGMPIFNRFTSLGRYEKVYKRFGSKVFVSTCVNDVDEIKRIVDLGFDKLLLDTANGWTKRMLDTILELRKYHEDLDIIAGNVCVPQAVRDLINVSVNSIRIGVGSGAACTTRKVTAVGVPQFSAVYDCAEEAKRFKIPVIADGGIKSSRELCLAIAAGATTVMTGKLFALTEESAAEKRYMHFSNGNAKEAKFRGQASEDFQKDHYGKVKEGTIAEGVDFWAPVSGSANKLLDDMLAGLRSSMTYLGAKSIKEYQSKATFMEVNPSTYSLESNPRTD